MSEATALPTVPQPLPKEPLELFAWYKLLAQTISTPWAVVVAWLVERSLPTPEVRGSNPGIGEILFIYSLSTVLKGRKQRKRGRKLTI